MFGFLAGKIKIIRSDHLILENKSENFGFGFIVFLSKNLIKSFSVGEFCEFLIETKIKNSEQIVLFGFQNEFQRIFFNHLCSISGISDKLAINICSFFSPKELLDHCVQNKTKLDFKIDGMGQKTWEKILFYLGRNKNLQQICLEFLSLNLSESHCFLLDKNSSFEEVKKDSNLEKLKILNDAKMALVSLGISAQTAQKLIENIIEKKDCVKDLKLEDLIKEALNEYKSC
jgi:Holliday junction resolvasome RuvABC DNA-binding subunit